jgi:hypothetical protein
MIVLMYKIKKLTMKRTKRTDQIILLTAKYEGNPHADPRAYNRIFADVLRRMADGISEVTDAWVDPEVVVWMHEPCKITAEVSLSPPVKRK